MKSSENLRLIVKLRRIYQRICDFLVDPFESQSRHHAKEKSDAEAIINKAIRLQKTMNGLLGSVAGWNSLSQWASVALVAFTFFFGLIALITGNIINARQSAKISELDKAASDAKSAQQTVEIELNNTKIQLAKTQDRLGPRRLTWDKRQYLAKMLADVPKTGSVYVTRYDRMNGRLGDDDEARELCVDISCVLHEMAGIGFPEKHADRPTGAGVISAHNVGVEFQRTFPTPKTQDPAWLAVFVKGMKDLGYDVRDGIGNPNCPSDCIVIEVGKKPLYIGDELSQW